MFDEQKAYQAIRESMDETITKLGVRAVRNLSFFPSVRKAEQKINFQRYLGNNP